MTTTNELLPCPFCGRVKAPRLTHYSSVDETSLIDAFVVICDASTVNRLDGCGAQSGCHDTEAEAIAAWNQRTEPDGRLRDALADGLKFLEAACEIIENYNGNADDARHYIENARALLAEPTGENNATE